MQTLIHKNIHKEEHKITETQSENMFRVIGLLLMILGITIAMLVLDIELLSLFTKS